jgi:hypothetical protein
MANTKTPIISIEYGNDIFWAENELKCKVKRKVNEKPIFTFHQLFFTLHATFPVGVASY